MKTTQSKVLSSEMVERILGRITKTQLQLLDTFLSLHRTVDQRKSVYTAFDGDDMHYLDWMCHNALQNGYTPINPETALGYYISTMSHHGSKVEVMRDCIALMLGADEFWVHTRNRDYKLEDMPEGVIAEMMLWIKLRGINSVKVFPIPTDNTNTTIDVSFCSLADRYNYDDLLSSLSCQTTKEIESRLSNSVEEGNLRQLVFISQDFYDLKHADWGRIGAYKSGFVPMCPDTLLHHFVLTKTYGDFSKYSNIQNRYTYMKSCKELWIFIKPSVDIYKEPAFPDHIVIDLYLWKMLGGNIPVKVLTWQDVEVPKYIPENNWALTTAEQKVNVGIV